MRIRLLTPLVASLALAGCGDDGTTTSPDLAMPLDLSQGDLARAPERGDGGVDVDGGACPAPPSPDYHPYLGALILSQTASPHQGSSSLAWVTVGYSTGIAEMPTPSGCAFHAPATPGGPPIPNAKEVHESAGTVTITGGTQTVVIPPPVNVDDEYVFTSDALLWPGDAHIALDISGACDVPATHFDLTMTKSPVVTGPAAGATVSRNGDLVITWQPGSGDLHFDLSTNNGLVSCVFDAAAGSGTVPATTMKMLPAGSAGLDLQLYRRILTTIAGRGYRVDIGSDVLNPDGTLFKSRAITLQ